MKALTIIFILCTLSGCASFGDSVYDFINSGPDTAQREPGRHPRTHREAMCAANPTQCDGLTPNRTQPRTHREMMCAANPFEC